MVLKPVVNILTAKYGPKDLRRMLEVASAVDFRNDIETLMHLQLKNWATFGETPGNVFTYLTRVIRADFILQSTFINDWMTFVTLRGKNENAFDLLVKEQRRFFSDRDLVDNILLAKQNLYSSFVRSDAVAYERTIAIQCLENRKQKTVIIVVIVN
ncbi:unnamed protein product [Peronospora belbahrii]|uniref:Uncharacterized protein n=1 Tax=Peronospora belbahrii TaxID=622444 RepID=A0ABN8D376_9STRA|nr:unnamed protein product [Peronospora belbahrii]